MIRVVVLVALTAVACSGGGGAGGDAGPAGAAGSAGSCTAALEGKGCFGACSACTLLTQAQVSAVVGIAVEAGDDQGDPHRCDWVHNGPLAIPDLQVLAYANISATGFEDVCHPRALVDAGISVTPVSGVGDDACATELQGLGGPVFNFIKGCWAYSIAIEGGELSDATILADEKALALDALPSL